MRNEETPGYIKTLALQLISCSLNYTNLFAHFTQYNEEEEEPMIREHERQMDSEIEEDTNPRTPPSFIPEIDLNQMTPSREPSENTGSERIDDAPINPSEDMMTDEVLRSPVNPQTPPNISPIPEIQIEDKNGYQLILKLLLRSERSLNMNNIKLINDILSKCHFRDVLTRFETRVRELVDFDNASENLDQICREVTENSRVFKILLRF